MTSKDFIVSEIGLSVELLNQLASNSANLLVHVGFVLADCLLHGHKVLVIGNGGSAAEAQHFVAELLGHYRVERQGLPALALTANSSILTAIANDYDYQNVFARQIQAWALPGDVVVGISTSGRSANVIVGLRKAREKGALAIALVGAYTAEVAPVSDEVISVPSADTPRVQEAHLVILHLLADLIEQAWCESLEGVK